MYNITSHFASVKGEATDETDLSCSNDDVPFPYDKKKSILNQTFFLFLILTYLYQVIQNVILFTPFLTYSRLPEPPAASHHIK